MQYQKVKFILLFLGISLTLNFPGFAQKKPIVIVDQGSFTVGGTVKTSPGTFDPIKHGAFSPGNQSTEGQTLHGDHAYVFYQIPEKAKKLPLVFWHGYGQFSKTWETTPDGRDGFQNIFLKKDYSRRGCTAMNFSCRRCWKAAIWRN